MKRYIKYFVTISLSVLITVLILISKDIFSKTVAKDVYHILVDAFFVPGIVICGFGLLVVASNGGTFDMLAFGIRKLFDVFRSDINRAKYKSFYDYRMAKSEHKKGFWYLVIIGLINIAISFIFLYFYYNV